MLRSFYFCCHAVPACYFIFILKIAIVIKCWLKDFSFRFKWCRVHTICSQCECRRGQIFKIFLFSLKSVELRSLFGLWFAISIPYTLRNVKDKPILGSACYASLYSQGITDGLLFPVWVATLWLSIMFELRMQVQQNRDSVTKQIDLIISTWKLKHEWYRFEWNKHVTRTCILRHPRSTSLVST